MDKPEFIHDEVFYNLKSPRIIVPKIIELLNPESVIDIGCGIGTFLYCFKEQGIKTVLGIDGPWVDKELLYKFISKEEFKEQNLESPLNLPRKYDLVICLEVAEHLSEKAADDFIKNLVDAGDVILFSAAIPLQGGQNHINEQWSDYWISKFNSHGYRFDDVLKNLFWNEKDIFWWYKQNMVLFVKDSVTQLNLPDNELKNAIHPEKYVELCEEMLELQEHYSHLHERHRQLVAGEMGIAKYFKMLIVSIFGRNRINQLKKILVR